MRGNKIMARYNPKRDNSEAVYDAVKNWRSTCLLENGAVFIADRKLWTTELLDEIDERFVQNLNMGEGNFLERLEVQLSGGSPQCKQLMAELYWLLLLFASNIFDLKKRQNVRLIWSWSGEGLSESNTMLSDSILGGLGSTGTAFNFLRWRELVFTINAMREFKSKPPEEKQRLSSSPWDFAQWLSSVPDGENRQFRHILTHLIFPDDFERASTVRDKRAILEAFGDAPPKTCATLISLKSTNR